LKIVHKIACEKYVTGGHGNRLIYRYFGQYWQHMEKRDWRWCDFVYLSHKVVEWFNFRNYFSKQVNINFIAALVKYHAQLDLTFTQQCTV